MQVSIVSIFDNAVACEDRSYAVTKHAAELSPDPWMMLAVTGETVDNSLANFVQCPVVQPIIQL